MLLLLYKCAPLPQITENRRVCWGRSGIHGWGLFARRSIQEGEMVIFVNLVFLKVVSLATLFYIHPNGRKKAD